MDDPTDLDPRPQPDAAAPTGEPGPAAEAEPITPDGPASAAAGPDAPAPFAWTYAEAAPVRRRRALRVPAALVAAALIGGGLVAIGEQVFGPGGVGPNGLSIAPGTRTPAVASSGIDAAAVAAKLDPAVVDVNARVVEVGGTGSSAGTGMIVTSGGEVVTNNHVVAGALSVTVDFPAQHQTHPARVIAVDPTQDIALLQVEGVRGLPTVTFANPSSLRVGEGVVAIGNAYGLGGTPAVSSGSIVGLNRAVNASDGGTSSEHLIGMVQTDAALARGDSGGPLVDAAGHVVGMDTAAATSPAPAATSTVAFAIPTGRVTSVVSKIQRGARSPLLVRARSSFLGIDVSTTGTSPFPGAPFGGDFGTTTTVKGALVLAVFPSTPAASVGLLPGDVITAAGGRTITAPSGLRAAISGRRPGQSLALTWQAGRTVQHGTVTLAQGPVA